MCAAALLALAGAQDEGTGAKAPESATPARKLPEEALREMGLSPVTPGEEADAFSKHGFARARKSLHSRNVVHNKRPYDQNISHAFSPRRALRQVRRWDERRENPRA